MAILLTGQEIKRTRLFKRVAVRKGLEPPYDPVIEGG